MKIPLKLVLFFLLVIFSPQLLGKNFPEMGKVHRLSDKLDQLLPEDARLEKIAGGFEWSEGPVWIPSYDYLLFSDIPKNTIYKWEEKTGLSIFMRPAGYSGFLPAGKELGTNGLTLDDNGNLVACDHGNRCIKRIDTDIFTSEILVSRYKERRLNSPNDLVFKSNGDLYFTDPPYGLDGLNSSLRKELEFNGVYLLRKSGELVLLTSEMTFPNGIGLSPDEKTLYVAQSDESAPLWRAFDIKPDGTIHNSRIFFDGRSLEMRNLPGNCDGLTVDIDGNIWATGAGGVHIFSPQAEHLGWLETGRETANCAFGNDGSVLYITADSIVCRIKTLTRGIGF